MAWYNKYRPTNFDEVIGQELVKTVLINSVKADRIKHGYLLTGPKGVGKTTIARIFGNLINGFGSTRDFGVDGENSTAQLDIIELDAASNTGVDNIRQLIESAQTPPFAGKYKVFIIDEVHMLSKSAMNAMLKILEEPPSYLVFLLATTNPEKLLPTVLSRLTTLPLTSHSIDDIVESLTRICASEKITFDQKSLELIAKRANGGQRDAINLLETLSSYELGNYTVDNVVAILGLVSDENLNLLSESLLNKDLKSLKSVMLELAKSSMDGETFLGEYLDYLLEKAINFDYDGDILILALSEVLSYRLPITTIPSAIALLQVNLRKNLGTLNVGNSFGSNNTDDSISKKKSRDEVDFGQITKESSSEVLQSTPQPPDRGSSNFDPKKIAELQSSTKVPPMLKVSTKGLGFVSFENNILTLSTSNPFFKPQLELPKNKEFLINFLEVGALNIISGVGLGTNNSSDNAKSVSKTIMPSESKSETKKELPKSLNTNSQPSSTNFSNDSDESYGEDFNYNEDFDNTQSPNNTQKIVEQNIDTKKELANFDNNLEDQKQATPKKKTVKIDSNSKVFYEMFSELPVETIGGTSSIPMTTVSMEELIPKKKIESPSGDFDVNEGFEKANSHTDWDSAVDAFFDL